MYFFSPWYPTKENSQRARRTAGCGVWSGCDKDKYIKVGSRLIRAQDATHLCDHQGEGQEGADQHKLDHARVSAVILLQAQTKPSSMA